MHPLRQKATYYILYIIHQPYMYLVSRSSTRKQNDAMHPLRQKATYYILYIHQPCVYLVLRSLPTGNRTMRCTLCVRRIPTTGTYNDIYIYPLRVSSSTFPAFRKQNDAMHPLRQKATYYILYIIYQLCMYLVSRSPTRKQNDAMHPLRQKATYYILYIIYQPCMHLVSRSPTRKQNDAMHPLRQKATYYILYISTVHVSS